MPPVTLSVLFASLPVPAFSLPPAGVPARGQIGFTPCYPKLPFTRSLCSGS